jgi:hypothetical protein
MYVFDPDGNAVYVDNDGDTDIDGASLDSPERLSISDPAAGTWIVSIDGYTVWKGKEPFKFYSGIVPAQALAKNSESEMGDNLTAAQIPVEFRLAQNYPNPFNPTTNINFDLPQASPVSLKIFNTLGQQVATLVNEIKGAGYHSVIWNGRNDANQVLPSGVYIYRIEAGEFVCTNKMVLVK